LGLLLGHGGHLPSDRSRRPTGYSGCSVVASAPRAPVPSLHHRLGQSIPSRCDRTGARSISSVRGSQRRGPCLGHRVPGPAPALARSSRMSLVRLVLAPAAGPGPLHPLGAQRGDCLPRPVARACPLPRARAGSSIRESGATRSTLPAAAPRSQAPSAATTAVSLCSHRTPRQVAASVKAATTAHEPSATTSWKSPCAHLGASFNLLSTPGPSARLGRRPPAASFPPGPPNLGTPLAPSLRSVAGIRNPQGGRTLWLRGRSERQGRRRPLRLGGTARDHGPRSRPFPHQPLPPPRGPSACRSTIYSKRREWLD
jgi:hypothetical protein